MAHDTAKRTQLRGLYVYKRLPMAEAIGAVGVAMSTARRWRADALAQGDDWEKARSAAALGEQGFADMARRLLEDYLLQHQAVMDQLRQDDKIQPLDRAAALASLSDSFHKTMASFRKVAPELDRQAVAMDTLQRLTQYVLDNHRDRAPALLEVLEPFGPVLAAALG